MRVKCPECQHKVSVYSRANTANDISTVYGKCQNAECKKFDHSGAFHVTFSHWIDPKAAAVQMTLEMLFDQLPAADQSNLLASLAAR